MRDAGRSALRLATALAPVVLCALLSGCGSGGSSRSFVSAPSIMAYAIGFPSGGAPPGFEGGVVEVRESATGAAMPDAAVSLNGVAFRWNSVNQVHEGAFAAQPGADVQLVVTVAGHTYRATGSFFTEGPSVSVPNPAPSRCENRLTWSGGSPASTGGTLVTVLDAAHPADAPVYGPVTSGGPNDREITLPFGALTAGDRLVVIGVTSNFPIPRASQGSNLVVVGARTMPLTVVDADFQELTIRPGNRGLVIGEALRLSATADICGGGLPPRDLTATATWETSDAAVVTVSNVAEPAGVVIGAGSGTAVVTGVVQGIRGSTLVGVRDFVRRDSTVPGEMLTGVTSFGTTVVAVGTNGTVLSSPDGITWTRKGSVLGAAFTSVAASPQLVAAVNYDRSSVHTSTDLVSWTPQDAGSGARYGLSSIIWTGHEFVAVGIGGAIATSADGVTWTARASGTPYTLTAVAKGGSQLVAIGGHSVVTSQDGVTWTARDLPSNLGPLQAIKYDGTQFFAVGDLSPAVSRDGVTWTRLSGPSGMMAVAMSPHGEMMSVGQDGAVATTTDGGATWITWKLHDFARLTGVTWTGTQWVVVGGYGTIFTSP